MKLYPATQPSAGVSFNLLHAKDGSRLKQQYVCAQEGVKVEREEMGKGYEFQKDRYVTFTAEELKALEEVASQTIEIAEFVPASKVDPLLATSPGFVWVLAGAAALLLFALPFLTRRARPPVAVVDAANCNGCRRCFADCPYAAVTLVPHPNRRPGRQLAVVDPDLCVGCGICAGACPSSTPFRSVEQLVTGIDMPQQPIGALRQDMARRIAALTGPVKIAVFGCECAAGARAVEDQGTAVMNLMCTGLLPPSFVEYALRGGADGVLVTGCREGSCAYRFGTHGRNSGSPGSASRICARGCRPSGCASPGPTATK